MKYIITIFLIILSISILSSNLNNLPWTKPQPYTVTPTKIVNCEYSNNILNRCQYTLKYQEKYFNFYIPKQITIGKDTTINIPPYYINNSITYILNILFAIIAIVTFLLIIPYKAIQQFKNLNWK